MAGVLVKLSDACNEQGIHLAWRTWFLGVERVGAIFLDVCTDHSSHVFCDTMAYRYEL